MPIFRINDDLVFPPVDLASEEGIVAVGGDANPDRLLLAYQSGIFPWPHEGLPLLWFAPDPRFVLDPAKTQINRSLKKAMRSTSLEIRADQSFEKVMKQCQKAKRKDQDGTWITDEMITGYTQLHERGFAHSIEAYEDTKLVGGLYGVAIGSVFFGESMFAKVSDASKIAFATLVANLMRWGFTLIDCQSYTEHLAKFGANFLSRQAFMKHLKSALNKKRKSGKWQLAIGPKEAVKIFGKL